MGFSLRGWICWTVFQQISLACITLSPQLTLVYLDHNSVMLSPAHRLLVRCAKLILKQMKICLPGANSVLQDCFEHTGWDMFREITTYGGSTNLEKYMTLVTSYISKWADDVTAFRTITTCLKQKPWMTEEVHRTCDTAFRSGCKHHRPLVMRPKNHTRPLQFAYHPNCSMHGALNSPFQLALIHLGNNNENAVHRLQSSAFNTIINQHMIGTIRLLDLNTPFCHWHLDFLTQRPQSGSGASSPITLHWAQKASAWLCAQPSAVHASDPRLRLTPSWYCIYILCIVSNPVSAVHCF